jgi:hypothetical protein
MKISYFIMIQGTIAYLPATDIKVDPPGIGSSYTLFCGEVSLAKGVYEDRNKNKSWVDSVFSVKTVRDYMFIVPTGINIFLTNFNRQYNIILYIYP